MPENQWDLTTRRLVFIGLLALIALALWYFKDIIRPLVVSCLLAYLFSPLINLLKTKTRLSRRQAANIVFFLAIILLILMAVIIIPSAIRQGQSLYKDISASLDKYQQTLNSPITLFGMQVHLEAVIPSLRTALTSSVAPSVEKAMTLLENTSRGFLWFLVIIVSTYHLMSDWDKLRKWLFSLAPEKSRNDVQRLYGEIRSVWLKYLVGQVRLMLVLAAIYSAAWAAIGLPGALLIGSLAGFLNLIPELGPGLAAAIAILVALLQGSNFLPISPEWFALLTGGIYLILNNFKTIYLQPRILGHSVSMHEGLVFIAIIAAIMLQGILGVLIVVPLLATVAILGRYVHRKLLGLDPFAESTHSTD